MSDAVIYERLNSVFHAVFFDESIKVGPATSPPDIEGWDSVAHVNLIAGIEAEFGIEFTTEELESLENVGDIARLIAVRSNVG